MKKYIKFKENLICDGKVIALQNERIFVIGEDDQMYFLDSEYIEYDGLPAYYGISKEDLGKTYEVIIKE